MLHLNLRELRLRLSAQINLELGLADIARATGIHQNLYGRYEANKVRRPDLDNMEKIFQFYRKHGLLIDGRLIEPGDLLAVA